ncbi:ABC transporter permease [Candidatus Peregrinibacteria bacterium]|jgi:lipopolysaccharide transport system permease protein|nr:ABC transporter permease [Candidatus Peregrinibacteria bacterium]MBT7703657.1 ABC transporter permease [Candidatus Peregrinibacteria bacterium]
MEKSKWKYYFEITMALARTDFKLRYHGSLLGYFWTLIKPLMIFGVLYTIFTLIMRFPVEHYQIYLLLGVIIWNFFAEGTQFGLASIFSKANLVSKVYFPRILVVIASTVSASITFILNFLVFIVFVIASDISFSPSMLFFPFYLIALYFVILGTSLILSVLYVRFRDLSHIWEIMLQIGFWFTPIFYTLDIVPVEYHRFFYLNPLARIIHYSRTIFLNADIPAFKYNLIVLVFSVGILLIGYFIFKRLNKNLIEHL